MTYWWRIQDFPRGECQSKIGGANLSFGIIFAENCMKRKTNWAERRWPSLTPPRSVIAYFYNWISSVVFISDLNVEYY